ncbi:uncharacterized protein LOC129113308 [Anoplopoma fimbria]|uniref:uncharacterized protein LOC129113308 n=1 Tax=Anoplopoma fimbria TaxID=229290 RepID=UPI0023EC2C4E|nr:uncharacterized protein LOC129113308 [Anoplopoma fimbria]
MSLGDLERKWKTALTSILEDLTERELRKLLFKLDKIPRGQRTEKHREEIPELIIQYYGTEGSISVIDAEMKVLPRNDARVQEPLRPFVEKLKKRQEKVKETVKKKTSDSGSVDKKTKPATGTMNKPASTKERKAAAGQVKSCQPDKMDPVGDVETKQKTESTKTTKTTKMDPVGDVKTKQKTESTKTTKTDPVGTKKPKQKTEQKEPLNISSLSLKSAESPETSKVQSEAVQTGRIKIMGIKSSNTRNTHLEVEFNGGPQTFYVTNRLLADVFGFKAEDDFTGRFSRETPLTADVQIKGNKITEIKKL